MNQPVALLVPPRTHRAGFTIAEVVIALAIIATAFVAVLGLIPAGMNASRQATDSTIVAAIFEHLQHQLSGVPLKVGAVPFSPAFFDERGVAIAADASDEELARRFYRAELRILSWKSKPAGTGALRPVIVELFWPADPVTGKALGAANPKSVATFAATTLTGPDWSAIDTSFVPKLEF